jgi:hypothetical protein
MGAMRTAFRPIGCQSGGARHTGRLLFHRPVTNCAAKGDDRHGPRGSGRTELFRPAAKPRRQRTFGVGHRGFQQILGSARHFQKFGHGPGSAAQYKDDLAWTIVNFPHEFFGEKGHG